MIQVAPVILCGGSGTRLWPLSRAGFPKQFLSLTGNESLFQQAAQRLVALDADDIQVAKPLIVTGEEHRFLAAEQLREVRIELGAALLEPVGRNTAPAITLAALAAVQNGSDPVLVVTPADQTVAKTTTFTQAMQQAVREAEKGSILGLEKKTRFYQASTSELFGLVQEIPQKETTPFYPRSPYAAAKLYAYWIVVNYREAYGMYACNGTLFNHESPRRGETFVTRKITRGLANIAQGLEECLYMGNLDALRDWGHAKDYVRMQWMMLQQEQPEDFVIATGVQYSVRQFIQWSAQELGITLRFEGQGVKEVAIVEKIEGDKCPALKVDQTIVRIDPRYFRPTEVETLLGDPSKAKQKLGWVPEITVQQMCHEMVANDLQEAQRHALLKANGYQVNVSVE